jgi:RHS repeat-associated protein
MNPEHQGQRRLGRTSFSRNFTSCALWASPALIAAALLAYAALPGVAQSQISGRVISAPQLPVSHADEKPRLPKAPAQVAMPAPPPMRIVPGLEEPLVATGAVSTQESKELDGALKVFHDTVAKAGPYSDYDDYAKPLLAFIAAHPKSNWNSALQLNLGLGYYHAGYFTRAFASFEKSWQLGRNATTPQARLMVDRAVGELAKMHARVGHDKELTAVLKDIGKRPIGGPATELIQGAREGLWTFHHNPGEAYLCGPKALKNVLITLKARPEQIKVAEDARSGAHGFSLTQVAALADKAKLKYTLVYRKPGEPIPVPSIINWKVHHYAAIVSAHGGKYQVLDPTFAGSGGEVLTAKAIDQESSGYFLVPAQGAQVKAHWRNVAARGAEAGAIYGMGYTNFSPNAVGCGDTTTNISNPTQTQTMAEASTGNGMCVAAAHTMVVSLNLNDTPVGYVPQKGSPVQTTLTYNQRDSAQPATFAFSNAGPKWSFSWMSYIQDDPANPGASLSRISPGGGSYDFGSADYYSSGVLAGRTINGEIQDLSEVWRAPVTGAVTSYEHRYVDGGKEVFTLSDGSLTFPRKMFMTSMVDPQGNTTTLNYDSTFRLTSVVDAMGRSTTFTYGLSTNPLLITQITDPFGRTSQLSYDSSGRLASITDPVGITSSFTYSGAEPTFITNLTTPYGTSTYSDTVNPNDPVETNTRSLTLTDPLGFTDFLYFYQGSTSVAASDPGPFPTGILTDNGLLNLRNTYYWDKHAFVSGVTMSGGVVQSEDFTKPVIYHWLHGDTLTITGRSIGNIKKPLERRIWYRYAGQTVGYTQGVLSAPGTTARVLDDGTSQEYGVGYNTSGAVVGQVTSTQDPKGRYTQYNYAGNLVDLLSVQRNDRSPTILCGTCWWNLAVLTYNSIHEPLTYTDAAGKVWTFTYNTAGQRTSIKDPNGKITTFNYDTAGRLSNVVNANSLTQVSYTYDSADRILTRTDSEGLTLAYTYDNLDRVTSVTYPDGTTELYDYTFQSGPNVGTASLELRKTTDRLGRVTTRNYDADRRLISVTEPTSGAGTRTTSYDYYENGVLKDITDANGNVTHWDVDIESRPTAKTYAFGTSSAQAETYTYEASTSRIKSITDANGQTKTFAYDPDDRVKGITYTGALNPTPNVTYTWDALLEHMDSMTDGLGTTNFTYVPVGTAGALKPASIDGPFANDVIGLTYDALGRPATRTITGGNETFGYDFINRMTSHGTPLGTFALGYLGQTDQRASQSVTNGAVTVSTGWGYDTNTNDRRLISIANSGITRSFTLGYGSGPVNVYDIMGIVDTAATGHPFATQSHSYGYDNIDRLLSATSTTPGNYSYGYDNLDNATSVTDPGFGSISPTFNVLNQLTAFNLNTYTYDNNGNTTSDGLTKTYKWDAENRLVEVDYTGTSNKSSFAYDGFGRRTVDAETIGGVTTTTRYLWCGSRICQTRDGSDVVQTRVLDEGELNVISGQKAVYMPDQLGSARDVLDGTTGNLISSIDYSPYGNPIATNGTFVPLYQYARLMHHQQSGLNLGTFRAQDGITGRFINLDPIRESGGNNLYAYVNGTPIGLTDVEGLCAADPDKCKKLLDEMQNDVDAIRGSKASDPKGLAQRFRQLPNMPQSQLPNHIGEFERRRKNLQKKIQNYIDEGCGDPPAYIKGWADQKVPASLTGGNNSPITINPPSPTTVGIGTIIVIITETIGPWLAPAR